MRRKCVGLARAEDQDAVNALRLETYSGAAEFKLLRPDLLRWDSDSTDYVVLAGWDDDGRLVATFQGIAAASAAGAEQIMGVSVDELDGSCFPAFVNGRAATTRGFGRSGLNSVLRWHFLRATIAAGFRATIGLAYAGAPRVNTMAAMGYTFFRPERVWDPEVEPIAPPVVVCLRAEGYRNALEMLSSTTAEAIAAYPWAGPALVLQGGAA